jgi:hypothetical protein
VIATQLEADERQTEIASSPVRTGVAEIGVISARIIAPGTSVIATQLEAETEAVSRSVIMMLLSFHIMCPAQFLPPQQRQLNKYQSQMQLQP